MRLKALRPGMPLSTLARDGIHKSLVNLGIVVDTVPQTSLPHELPHIQQRMANVTPADAHRLGANIDAGAHDGLQHLLRPVIMQQRADVNGPGQTGCP